MKMSGVFAGALLATTFSLPPAMAGWSPESGVWGAGSCSSATATATLPGVENRVTNSGSPIDSDTASSLTSTWSPSVPGEALPGPALLVSVLAGMSGNVSDVKETNGIARARANGWITNGFPSLSVRVEAEKEKNNGTTAFIDFNPQGYQAWFADPHYFQQDPMTGQIFVEVNIAACSPDTFAVAEFENIATSGGVIQGSASAFSAGTALGIIQNSMYVQNWPN